MLVLATHLRYALLCHGTLELEKRTEMYIKTNAVYCMKTLSYLELEGEEVIMELEGEEVIMELEGEEVVMKQED
jgi:hypothetical protein